MDENLVTLPEQTNNSSDQITVREIGIKVDSMRDYVNNAVTLSTSIFVAIIGLFVLMQWIYARRMQREDLENTEKRLEKSLEDKINKITKEHAENLSKTISNNLLSFENSFEFFKNKSEGEFNRLFAFTTQDDKLYPLAASRWIDTAYYYELAFGPSEKLISLALGNAQKNAGKIEPHQIERLRDLLPEIYKSLEFLKTNHQIEVDVIKEVLSEKLKPSPPAKEQKP